MSGHPLLRVVVAARPVRGRIALGIMLGVLAVGASVALMATSGYLISRASMRPPILSLAVAIVGVRFFGVSRGVFRYLERLAAHDAALRLLGTLRATFFQRLEPLVPDGLPAGSRTADLLSRFVGDVDELQHVFVRSLGPPLVALVVGVGAVAVAFATDPRSGAVLAVALLAGGLLVPLLAASLLRATVRREAPARAALLTEVLDVLDRSAELVVAGRTAEALGRVSERERSLRRLRRRTAVADGAGEGLVTLAAGLAAVGVAAAAGTAVQNGRLDGVLLGMLVLLALASFEAIRPLPGAVRHLGAGEAAAGRVYDLVDRAPPVAEPDVPAAPPAGVELRAEGVSVRGRLDAVDVTLRRGRTVALVGPSGAGKTTLTHCLVRFRDPDGGRVLLDGRDLSAYAQSDVRRLVLLVEQDAHLFATTIRENLRIARPGADDGELREALRRARLLEWADGLPAGLDTHVGERGELVSGGERQRLALARAFLSRAAFVVVDEPTAHLDEGAARGVVATLLDLAREGRGVLLVTHGTAGLDRVDEVVALASS